MRIFLLFVLSGLALLSCRKNEEDPGDQNALLFRHLPARRTGVAFANKLRESWFNNYYNYAYFYNGGGVAAGDLDNDGLPELFFVGNQTSNKLYRNKGGLSFEDVTDKAGVGGDDRWDTGVTLADVDGDGWLDIYVCASGKERPNRRRNRLYTNNRNLTFTERAAEFGLDDPGYSTQAAFFDYDRDGDLDCYLLNHPIAFNTSNEFLASESKKPDYFESDKLYRNDNGRFTDVTIEAGVRNYGYGLGVAVSDFNQDGWPDVYVANDFNTPDFLYINRQDGAFTDRCGQALGHTANFGMGCDAADINNDGRPDLVEVDMMPDDNRRRKISMPGMGMQAFRNTVEKGFGYQYMQNALQLNVPLPATAGAGPPAVAFAEIAELAGVARTDWSWSPLLADFDNDGFRDLYISNGMRREVNNNDFTYYFRSKRGSGKVDPTEYFRELNNMPVERVNKYAFRNGGKLDFQNVTGDWGLTNHHFTNGAAYSDLDRDGDLDLVLNNLDSLASVYENRQQENTAARFLRVQCKGSGNNRFGIGARVVLRYGGQTQHGEVTTTRGFLSAVEPVLHFGLGAARQVDTLEVTWPSGKVSVRLGVKADREVVVEEAGAVVPAANVHTPAGVFLAEDTAALAPAFRHRENAYDDFAAQPLLPHRLSAQGPCLAAGDVNGDGLGDFYVGGAAGQSGALYLQTPAGTFRAGGSRPWTADKDHEDVGGAFFDADGDHDLDLYVVSGGGEFPEGSPLLQDRLYLNDGKGGFTRSAGALPGGRVSGSCAVPGDFDGDGDADLLVGGGAVPGRYPVPSRSFLLRNDKGVFTDVTAAAAPGLVQPGLVKAAHWTDFDGDRALDLIVAGEWMPVQLYKNQGGKLALWNADRGSLAKGPAAGRAPGAASPAPASLRNSGGWWSSAAEVDVDRDGDADYVLGNVGLNYPYQASPAAPFHLYAKDFDDNGSVDPVLAYEQGGRVFPWRGRQALAEQLPFIRRQYPDFASFAAATLEGVFGREALRQSLHYTATEFASVVLINEGKGRFTRQPLPRAAQLSCVNGIVADDFNGDGHADLLLAGNNYATESETRRNDAGYGLVLLGDGKGRFSPVSPAESGFFAPGDVRSTARVETRRGSIVLVSNNGGMVQAFRVRPGRGPAAGRAGVSRGSHTSAVRRRGNQERFSLPSHLPASRK